MIPIDKFSFVQLRNATRYGKTIKKSWSHLIGTKCALIFMYIPSPDIVLVYTFYILYV